MDLKISLVKSYDEESYLKQGELLRSDGQENVSLAFKVGRGLEDRMIFEVLLLMISWEEKSKVFLGPDIFFNDLGDRRMKLSNEDDPMLDLEEWNSSNVDSFVEK